jgi:hypothetical protein
MDEAFLIKNLSERREIIIFRIKADYVAGKLTEAKANGYAGALYEIDSLLKKDRDVKLEVEAKLANVIK